MICRQSHLAFSLRTACKLIRRSLGQIHHSNNSCQQLVKVLASSPVQALIPDLITSAGTQLLDATLGWVLSRREGQATLRHEAVMNFVYQQEARSRLDLIHHPGRAEVLFASTVCSNPNGSFSPSHIPKHKTVS